jgi:hypothetical protein
MKQAMVCSFIDFLGIFHKSDCLQGLDAEADEAISMISDVTTALTSTVHHFGVLGNIDVSKN